MSQNITLQGTIAVFVGGGVGCILRYIVGGIASKFGTYAFPYHTLAVNLLSCFIMGMVAAFFVTKIDLSPSLKLLLMTGFCGGLSTFSALSLEVVELFQAQHYVIVINYILLSVLGCILAVILGMLFGKFVGGQV